MTALSVSSSTMLCGETPCSDKQIADAARQLGVVEIARRKIDRHAQHVAARGPLRACAIARASTQRVRRRTLPVFSASATNVSGGTLPRCG